MRHSCWPDPHPMLYCSYVLALLRISILVMVWVTKLRVLSAFLHSFDDPFDIFLIVPRHCFKVVRKVLIIRESIDNGMKLCDSVLASTDHSPFIHSLAQPPPQGRLGGHLETSKRLFWKVLQSVPKKRTFRMLLEPQCTGSITSSRPPLCLEINFSVVSYQH